MPRRLENIIRRERNNTSTIQKSNTLKGPFPGLKIVLKIASLTQIYMWSHFM
jgi:hypothetical protein